MAEAFDVKKALDGVETPEFYKWVVQSPTQLATLVGALKPIVFDPERTHDQRADALRLILIQYLPIGWTVSIDDLDDTNQRAKITVTPGAGPAYTVTQGF